MAAPPQADAALHKAAGKGDLATLTRLASEGVNLDAKGNVSAAPPVAPCPLRPGPTPSPRRPPPLPRPHRRRSPRVAQCGNTALMYAALKGKLGCLEQLIAKGANLNAENNVRRLPALGRPARMQAGRGANGACTRHRHPPTRHRRSPTCVGPPPRFGRTSTLRCTARFSTAALPASSRCSRRGPTRASRLM